MERNKGLISIGFISVNKEEKARKEKEMSSVITCVLEHVFQER